MTVSRQNDDDEQEFEPVHKKARTKRAYT